jgi:uncharacterized protein with GYD domain
MFRASYTQQGIQGVLKEGAAARIEVVNKLAESLGGRCIASYWAFGPDDFITIFELPDNAAAAAGATRVAATGTASISTTVLLTAADVDEAIARSVTYRPPGG